jgi:hypothetical protein
MPISSAKIVAAANVKKSPKSVLMRSL